ncbi:hypothetical protein QBC44DRAFT_248385 [Cladorrhinum sp. PSN332]|nr:hypothetical protein QBC44DRAFT_248385 [Cladorrhinum sp. PSN332]
MSSSSSNTRESWGTFNPKVERLAPETIWPCAHPSEFSNEDNLSGLYNLVTGISRKQGNRITRCILRVPDTERSSIDDGATMLRFMNQQTSIPVPKVLTLDRKSSNVLGRPYMAQKRISGVDLSRCDKNLDHQGSCRIAKELGSWIRTMLQIKSQAAGKVVYGGLDGKSFSITTLPDLNRDEAKDHQAKHPKSSGAVLELLIDMLKKRRAACVAENNTAGVSRTDKVFKIAIEIQNGGWLNKVEFTLTHLDFFARNILINTDGNGRVNEPAVAAILDWDDALFVPAFVGCAPPAFLWSQP